MIPFLTRQLTEIAILEYKMNRVEIRCHVGNFNSSRVAEKVGYKYEGILRNAMIHRGNVCDVKIYSFTKEDLEQQGNI